MKISFLWDGEVGAGMEEGMEQGGEVVVLLLCLFLFLFPSPPLNKFLFHPHLLCTTFPLPLAHPAPLPPPPLYQSRDLILLPTLLLLTHHHRVSNTGRVKEMHMMSLTQMNLQRSPAFFWVGEKVVHTCHLGPCHAVHLPPYHHANLAYKRHR